MEYGIIRTIKDDTIISPFLPRLGIQISPNYIYLGDLQYILRDTHHVEEFIFLNPSAIGHVTQLLLVRFAGFLDNKPGAYRYPENQAVQLDGDSYLYDISFINIQDYLAQYPQSDIAHAADYIRQRAYTLAGDFIYQRFLRLVSQDGRHEFTIAYLSNNDERGLTTEMHASDSVIASQQLEQALKQFTIVR